MSSSGSFACKHCGRSNFRTSYGLTQHQQTGPCHDALLLELQGNQGTFSPRRLRSSTLYEMPLPPQKEEATFHLEEDLDGDDMEGVVLEMDALLVDETGNDNWDEESADDDPRMPHIYGDDEDNGSESSLQSNGTNGDEMPVPEEVEGAYEGGPITSIREQFRAYTEGRVADWEEFNEAEKASIRLLALLKDKKAALNTYRALMEWHLRGKGDLREHEELKDCRNYISREVMMKELRSRYNMNNKYPYRKKVKLPISGSVVKLTMHDPLAVLQSLLTDPRVEDDDYLFFDDDPLAPPPEKQTKVADLNTGQAYRRTHTVLIDREERQQLLPLILYIDGSAISHFHQMEVTQVKVSLGLWNRRTRTKSYAWRVLGYIEKVHQQGGRGQKIWDASKHMEVEDGVASDEGSAYDELPGVGKENLQDLHAQIEAILSTCWPLFERGILWDQKHKGVLYRDIHYKPYISFVKCDNKEADNFAGKYGSRQKGVKHLCRFCDIPTKIGDHHLYQFQYKTEPQINKLVEQGNKEELKAMSQHYLLNGFYDLPFHKADTRGIHGACPVDMLHAIQLGLFKYVRDIFFEQIGPTSRPAKDINGLSKVYGRCFARQSDTSIPSCQFSKGIQEGKLMGKEYRGILLLMLVMMVSKAGRTILRSSRKGSFNKVEEFHDWQMLVETLLMWEAYLHQEEMELRDVRKLVVKHRYIMYLMRSVAPRDKGMGLKVMKFHSILHLADNILLYGVPLEFDTGPNESHHKAMKAASKLTQRAPTTFNIQTATRLVDFEVIELAMLEIEEGKVPWDYYLGLREEGDAPTNDMGSSSCGGQSDSEMGSSTTENTGYDIAPRTSEAHNERVDHDPVTEPCDAMIKVFLDDENGEAKYEMVTRSVYKDKTRLNSQLVEWLLELQGMLHDELGGNDLRIYTRIKRGGVSFRAHPNYRGKGPWRDWAFINYGRDYGALPSHIWCFVVIPEMQSRVHWGGILLEEGIYAVVECTKKVTEPEGGEVRKLELLAPYEKEVGLDEEGKPLLDPLGHIKTRIFYLADTDAITGPCCAVPDIGGPPNRYYVVDSREMWADGFMEWLHEPFDLDEIIIEGDEEELNKALGFEEEEEEEEDVDEEVNQDASEEDSFSD